MELTRALKMVTMSESLVEIPFGFWKHWSTVLVDTCMIYNLRSSGLCRVMVLPVHRIYHPSRVVASKNAYSSMPLNNCSASFARDLFKYQACWLTHHLSVLCYFFLYI